MVARWGRKVLGLDPTVGVTFCQLQNAKLRSVDLQLLEAAKYLCTARYTEYYWARALAYAMMQPANPWEPKFAKPP